MENILLLISTVTNTLVLPIVALFITKSERHQKERNTANREFNNFVLWGMQAIGGLTKVNTAILNGKDGEGSKELEMAAEEYERFRKEINRFTQAQTSKTL